MKNYDAVDSPESVPTKEYVDDTAGQKVAKAGDTMTGDLTIANPGVESRLIVSSTTSNARVDVATPAGLAAGMQTRDISGEPRWFIGKGSSAESGANSGSNLVIHRYDDDGGVLGTPITILRATGGVTLEAGLTASDIGANTVSANTAPTSAAHLTRKDYVDGGAWVACSNGSGMTGTVYARLVGGHCQLAGNINGTFTGNPTVITLPNASYKPVFPGSQTYFTFLGLGSGSPNYVTLRVWANLNVTVAYVSATAPTGISLDALRWPVT